MRLRMCFNGLVGESSVDMMKDHLLHVLDFGGTFDVWFVHIYLVGNGTVQVT